MNTEIQSAIIQNISWGSLPAALKQVKLHSNYFLFENFISEYLNYRIYHSPHPLLHVSHCTISSLQKLNLFCVFQSLGNSHKEFEKCIVSFSITNQLRYRENLSKYSSA